MSTSTTAGQRQTPIPRQLTATAGPHPAGRRSARISRRA